MEQEVETGGSVASTSEAHGRTEKSGYNELPKEMHEMKLRDDKTDNHVENAKV